MSEEQPSPSTADQTTKSISYVDLNSALVTEYLDAHPEFLSEYLRKSQIHHRITKLFNENKSGQIFEKLRYDAHTNHLGSEGPSSFKAPLPPISKSDDSKQVSLTSASSEPKMPLSKYDDDVRFNSLLKHQNKKEKSEQIINYRREFSQLGLHEKMFTLVKTLYDSLDMKTTCEKVLNTVSLLLNADRCSLFLVIEDDNFEEKKCLISLVFDAQSTNSSKQSFTASCDFENDKIRIPYGKGIAGHVAATGQALNIQDAYQDPRFNSSIDSITGYRTKSVLCLPILDENGQCIAVAEAINKSTDFDDGIDTEQRIDDQFEPSPYFNKEDEETFEKFMPYIAMAIRNSNLYAQSCKEAQTNKVLLELATIVFDETSTTLDNLMSRILVNSLYLLQCEKCQVVLLNNKSSSKCISHNNTNRMIDRIYELNYAENMSSNITVVPNNQKNTLRQCELDIVNSVIKSGEILNIPSVKDNKKYANLCEANYSLNSILCIPVINGVNKVVALIYASNKIKKSMFNSFTESDINVAQAFGLFCGIGIQNIMMYEKVVGALNMQQVALDVLSYHVSSTQEEVDVLMVEQVLTPIEYGLNDFGFDENTLDDMNTLKGCISMFGDLGFIEKYNIPYDILCRFFLTVKKNYRPVAYHNWRHGFNVMSTMYSIMKVGKYNQVFSDLEIFALLIACICHDLDHRGTSNKFQIKIQSPLAKLYTTSTMEHHHFNQCIIILHNNMNNILMNLTQSQHSTVIEIVEKAILATDLALHFACFDKFLEKANSTNNKSFETNEEKDLLMSMLMTASDLSGATKKWDCHYRLSKQVSSEFFNEGDLEKERFKKEPSDQMNRNKPEKLPRIQIQFLNSVCVPLYKGLNDVNGNLEPMYQACNKNIEKWQAIIDEKKNSQDRP